MLKALQKNNVESLMYALRPSPFTAHGMSRQHQCQFSRRLALCCWRCVASTILSSHWIVSATPIQASSSPQGSSWMKHTFAGHPRFFASSSVVCKCVWQRLNGQGKAKP